MKNKLRKAAFVLGIGAFLMFGACNETIDPLVESIDYSRVFSPLSLTAKVVNKTSIEVKWKLGRDASKYVVEVSEDSMAFTNIVKVVEVSVTEIPVTIQLEGDTQYSVRVKGVSASDKDDSKWTAMPIRTQAENIFILPVASDDINATSVTLRWPAGEASTKIVLNPGNIEYAVTSADVAAGTATVNGLVGETNYTAIMYNGNKTRGTATFKTLVDIGDAIAVYPSDNLQTVIANAPAGSTLVLFPGDYKLYSGVVVVDKGLAIKGYSSANKAVVHVHFRLTGTAPFSVTDLDMSGVAFDAQGVALSTYLDHAFEYHTTGVSYGALKVVGCNISNYNKSLLSGSASIVSSIESVLFDNCIVTNVLTNSADFIDVRGGYLTSLTLQNSTFNNCAPARDFIRLDNSSANFPSKTTTILIDKCTIYKSAKGASGRIFYVRFATNSLTFKNSIIAEGAGYYTNQSLTTQPDCSNNNYSNAPAYLPGGTAVAGVKFDQSSNYKTLNPGFKDASNGDFTVTNDEIVTAAIGDPRWR